MKPPVITRFVVKPSGTLTRSLELSWEPGEPTAKLAWQRFQVEVRPSGQSVEWSRFTVRAAHSLRITTHDMKLEPSSGRADLFEARVGRWDGSGLPIWSEVEVASALRREAMVAAPEKPTQRERPPVAAASSSSLTIPSVYIVDASIQVAREGLELTASWDCIAPNGRSSWAPEFELAVRAVGSDRWTTTRTAAMVYRGVVKRSGSSGLDVKVRARLGGQVGAWSSARTVFVADSQTTRPVAKPGGTPSKSDRTAEIAPKVTGLQALLVPEGVVVTASWRYPDVGVGFGLVFDLQVRSTRPGSPWAESRTTRRTYRALIRDTTLEGLELCVRAVTTNGAGPWSQVLRTDVAGPSGTVTGATEPRPTAEAQPERQAALADLRAVFLADVAALQRKLSMRRFLDSDTRASEEAARTSAHVQDRAVPTRPPPTRRELRALRDESTEPVPAGSARELEIAAVGEQVARLTQQVSDLASQLAEERDHRRTLEHALGQVLERLGLLENDGPQSSAPRGDADAPGAVELDAAASSREDRDPGTLLEVEGEALALARALISSPLYDDQLAKAGRAAPEAGAARALLESLARHNYALFSDLAAAAGLAPNQMRGLIAALRRLLNIDGYDVLSMVGGRVAMDWQLAAEQFELVVDRDASQRAS